MSETSREVSEWDPTEGRRRAPGANRTALGPTREALWYFWSASLDHQPTPIEWGTGLHLDLPDNSSPEVSLLTPTEGSLAHSTPPSERKGCTRVAQKARGTPDRPLALRRGSGALPAHMPRPSNPNSHLGAWQNAIKGTEPVTVQGFEGWAPEGFDSCPRKNKVRGDYG